MSINTELLEMDIDEFNEATELHNGFVIDSPELAEWGLSKVKEEKERLNIFELAAKSKIEQLKVQLENEKRKSADRNSFLLFKLNEYLDRVPAKTTKTKKSLALPSGKIVRTFQKLDYSPVKGDKKLNEDELLIQWVKDNAQEFLKETSSVTWGELKKKLKINQTDESTDVIYTPTGEVLDCITVKVIPPSIDVE